ncbi:hypothetical protein [Archangium lipolyticum]|uniref:hypothetical protein n=1 Tax=Archangium lipolyticum TaxID=2970465 RepID=UPI00214A284A|nr:hypothetical protein [Archangium lipolyticum]
MMRRIAIASLALATGCATMQDAQTGSSQDRMRIANQFPFDTAVCQSQALALPQPLNPNTLVGALFSSQPEVMECLVDPKSRGEAKATKVIVKDTITDQGGTHAISGENLTAEGQACIQKALNTRVPLTALPAGAQPVEYQTEFTHDQDTGISVKFGLNSGSDYSGGVRLGQASWCDCYAGFANKVPPTLQAAVHLRRIKSAQEQALGEARVLPIPAGQRGDAREARKAAEEIEKSLPVAVDITFDPAGTPEGDQLAACLKEKMMTVPMKLETDQLKFTYRFAHLNSRATEPASHLAPEMRFFQMDLMRGQRSADAAIAIGGRDAAAAAYDAVVTQYQTASKRKQLDLLSELSNKCGALVTASQKIVDAISAQLQVDQQTLTLTQELKAKDPSFAEIETRLQEAVGATQQDLDNSKKRLEDDKKICEKLK